jgi:nitrate/TMAO reductase-like tetraheme cytochrome c subunit
MTRWREITRDFFFPPREAPAWRKLLPYASLGVLTLVLLVAAAYGWEYTNSPDFCGTTCHTMPPEFSAYLVSPHARIDCVDCHIGRGFIATRITRKAGDLKHVVIAAFKTYEFPIRIKNLRPARETCEKCHFPQKFSDDSLREIKRFSEDMDNTPFSIYLTLKTGGGSKRQGLGRGIHWHIENKVFYLPADPQEEQIPYVRAEIDGQVMEYLDIEADFDPSSIDPSQLREMDCITCHNRITHLVPTPEDTVDQLLARGLISPTIPEIRRKAVEVYSKIFDNTQSGLNHIAGLEAYYRAVYPDFYAADRALVRKAIQALQEAYARSVFPEQKSDWTTHPNHVGHKDSPGCFRCHDGKHLNDKGEAIRLECNLCHSIPVVAGPEDFVARIEIVRGPEPQSHLNPNWITLHRDIFDPTCANCHTTGDPGGTSDSSFCSNSACHGVKWEYAGFDAPKLREILRDQIPTPAPTISAAGPLTFEATIGPLLQARCGACHGEQGIQGLNLTDYAAAMRGGESGPAIVPGDPQASLLVQIQRSQLGHFGQLSSTELELVEAWIAAGAPQR